MKKLTIALAVLGASLSMTARAHGDAQPLHGGIVKVAADMQYELVPGASGAALYVIDHGKPADASRMGGKLTVLSGTQKSEAELRPAGGNKLEAAGVSLPKGAKVVATVRGADGKSVNLRYSLP